MADLSQGRKNVPTGGSSAPANQTISGSKGLDFDEPLIFEMGEAERTGIDMDVVEVTDARLGGLRRKESVGLPLSR